MRHTVDLIDPSWWLLPLGFAISATVAVAAFILYKRLGKKYEHYNLQRPAVIFTAVAVGCIVLQGVTLLGAANGRTVSLLQDAASQVGTVSKSRVTGPGEAVVFMDDGQSCLVVKTAGRVVWKWNFIPVPENSYSVSCHGRV